MEVFIKLIHYHTVHSPLGFMTHVTCKLTAQNRDQLRNPTLGNRAWAAFTFFYTVGVEPDFDVSRIQQ